jgi:hypothetical protein
MLDFIVEGKLPEFSYRPKEFYVHTYIHSRARAHTRMHTYMGEIG